MSMRFISTYSVTGGGDFPIDMLRYDSSYPRSEQDSGEIERGEGRRTIHLEHRGGPDWHPTEGRWKSFGWEVDWGSIQRKKGV